MGITKKKKNTEDNYSVAFLIWITHLRLSKKIIIMVSRQNRNILVAYETKEIILELSWFVILITKFPIS